MITEDYVSFETAKLLKEKGFENDAISCINVFKGHIYKIQDRLIHADDDVTIPTLQMAIKWLRKNHQIFIRPNINFLYPIRYYCEIFCYGDNLKTQQDVTTENFESPEEACEAAIKYCLENLI